MSVPKLENSIREVFAPSLRAEGFTGSGRNYRRLFGEWVQVVNIQGSNWGGRFYINLATHPIVIPDTGGDPPNPKTILEYHCEFRRRLEKSVADQWWEYDRSQVSMDATVKSAAAVYAEHGRRFFDPQSGVVAQLLALRACDLVSGSHRQMKLLTTDTRISFALARFWSAKAQFDVAAAFADYALSNLGRGVNLRPELLNISKTSQQN
jgi:hypothetical protein